MKPKYTQGPWRFVREWGDERRGHAYGTIVDANGDPVEPTEANMVLKAAAPKLFEAGRQVVEYLQFIVCCEADCTQCEHYDGCDLVPLVMLIDRLTPLLVEEE